MKNTSTEERELHTAQNIINAGTGQSADVEQMCEWFEKHPKARNLLTDAKLLAGEIAAIDPERKKSVILVRLRTRYVGYKRARMGSMDDDFRGDICRDGFVVFRNF